MKIAVALTLALALVGVGAHAVGAAPAVPRQPAGHAVASSVAWKAFYLGDAASHGDATLGGLLSNHSGTR